VNERYNLFETKQQLTDDLRVLTRSKFIPVNPTVNNLNTFESNYECNLPSDYFHILNCICRFRDKRKLKCKDSQSVFEQGANKLDTNQWSHVINNYYMKPSVRQPYYYIINIEDPVKGGQENTGQEKNKMVNPGQESRYGNSVMPIM
jgi:hypothetical protein